jgi:hypothetical protein
MDEQKRPAGKSPGDIGRIKNKIVVGLPSSLDGTPTPQTARAKLLDVSAARLW